MGSSQKSLRHGRAAMATPSAARLASAVLRRRGGQPAVRRRPVTGARYFIMGYLRARSPARRRLGDADFTRFLRRYQLRALRTGKREAAEWAFRERERALAPAGSPVRRTGADLPA